MNLFYLDKDVKKCAEYHCDKHVVKMILETAQLLSTTHRVLDGEEYIKLSKNNRKLTYWKLNDEREQVLYQVFGINHPVSLWVRKTSGNYEFALNLFIALNNEYEYRYNKIHKSKELLNLLSILPKNITINEMTSPALAMPEKYFCNDEVESYRNYYRFDKKEILHYTKRNKPDWI
jgi:hypothetical protein